MNSINSISIAPCQDTGLKELCSEYADTLPCCDAVRSNAVMPKINKLRDRSKILWNKTNCVDLFELKEELFDCGYFREIQGVGWSMFPTIKNGDLLKIIPCKIEDLEIGNIPVYRMGNKFCAHRIIDKKVIDGKNCLTTRGDISDKPESEKVEEGDLLGKITQIKRRKMTLSPEKRKMTIWSRLLYKKAIISLKLKPLLEIILKTILTKIQSFKFYKVLAKKLTENMKSRLNFELALPFFNEKLNRIYKYTPLKDNKKVDFSGFKEAKIFHLVMKFNNIPIGCVSFLKRPRSCPYKGFWICDVYIRLRYRGLGFSPVLLKKTEEIFKEAEIDIIRFFKRDNFLNNAEELLLICARKVLNQELKRKAQQLIKEGVHWEHFIESTTRGGVTILVYEALRMISSYGYIPQFVFDKLKSDYLSIMTKFTFQYKELLELLELFAKKNIPVVSLKGPLLSKRLYGDIAVRGMSADFDLLIEKKYKEKARILLEKTGYSFVRNNKGGWQGCYIFSKPKAKIIELHWDIITMFGRSNEGIEKLRKGIRLVKEEGVSYYEFKEDELLIYLCTHLVSSDFFRQLRYVCDIHELLNRYKALINWESIVEKAKSWKLSSSLYTGLKLSKEFFNSEVPAEVLRKLKPNFLKLLIIRIFANKKVILQKELRRKRLMGPLNFIFFGLIEARSPKEGLSVFFPPKEVIRTKCYGQRIFKGVLRLLR